MIHVCVPVLNRYDMLRELLLSLRHSTMPVHRVWVVDNGQRPEEAAKAIRGTCPGVELLPLAKMGLAETWNWFIEHVPQERFIVNDDIVFAPESIAKMVAAPEDFVSCTFGFSCFLIRDACVAKVGLFDETLSPGYAYFEDMDYLRRMRLAGVQDAVVQCGVQHRQSQTVQAFTAKEQHEHNKRFKIAEANYAKKWRNNPSWEQLRAIGGEGAHVD